MMSDITVPLAAIGLVGSILALVVTPLFKLLQANTNATNSLVKETEKGNREAKERNGHLGEQNIKITKLILAQNGDSKKNLEANQKVVEILSKSALIAAQDRDILTNQNQIIAEQTVEHQTVKKKG